MRLTRFRLNNIGRHEKVDFDCDASVWGIVGPNGSGKSTAMTMIKFLFTGETEDPIDSYVRNYDGNASTDADFLQNGKTGLILRQFGKTTKRRLEWEENKGDKAIKSAKEIENTIAKLFGADRKAVANAVFIQQGEMENILFTLDSDRKKSFIKLVNLSHLAARAEIVMGKIRKLRGTIVDLTPARDAALMQRQQATATLETERTTLKNMADWSAEIAFVAAYDLACGSVENFNQQLEKLKNDAMLADRQLQVKLQTLAFPDVETARQQLTQKETAFDQMDQQVQQLVSIQAELVHFDRAQKAITDALAKMTDLDKERETLNPEKLSSEQWEEKRLAVAQKLKHLRRRSELDTGLSEEQGNHHRFEGELSSMVVPEVSREALQKLEEDITKTGNSLHWLYKTQQTRLKIAGCVQGVKGQVAECTECGLSIVDGGDLAPEEMTKLDEHVQQLRTDLNTLKGQQQTASNAWSLYDQKQGRLRGLLEGVEQRRVKLQQELDGLPKVEETTEALESEQTRLQDAVNRLEEIPNERGEAVKEWNARRQEKNGYTLAIANQNKRATFESKAMAERVQARDRERNALRDLRFELGEINKMVAAQEEKNRQREQLQGDLDAAVLETQKPLSEQLQNLMVELSQVPGMEDQVVCWQSATAEIQVRQNQLLQAQGREQAASEAYHQANQNYHDLDQRMEQDKVKLEVVKDLEQLRDLLLDDGLPMAYVRHQFEHLARITQEGLVKLKANFAIRIDRSKDLTFSFIRLDESSEVEHPMNKLSGGQRVRLCLAFLMAVQQRLVKDVGLLVLDEPSTHLDEAGVQEVVEFLSSMRQTLQNTDHQLIVVDHHPAIQNALEKCLVLTSQKNVASEAA